MTMVAEAAPEVAVNPNLVPSAESERVNNVITTLDGFFSPEAALQNELDKEIHHVTVGTTRHAEIVKYCTGDRVVRSVEIPLDANPLLPGVHDALAFSITTRQDGASETEKHRFSWQVLPNGKQIRGGREPGIPFDSGDYRLLEVFTGLMKPRRLSKVLF